jgi:hypothetical protein
MWNLAGFRGLSRFHLLISKHLRLRLNRFFRQTRRPNVTAIGRRERISEAGAVPLYRTYDPIKELRQQLLRFAIHCSLLGVLVVAILAAPTPNEDIRIALDILVLVIWVKPMAGLVKGNEHVPKELKKEEAGLEAEKRIAQTIKDTFRSQQVKVFSRLDHNCLIASSDGNTDLDVLAIFPKGQRFAISIKKREAKKVCIDADNNIRLIRKGSTVKMTRPDPAKELIEQEKWLRQHRKNLLLLPGNTMILPAIRVLLFATPTVVGEHQPHQYASIGDQKFVKAGRGKDFVYLIQEDQLCQFMTAILKLKS